jgi:PTS system nitrogen regulatory IIA component
MSTADTIRPAAVYLDLSFPGKDEAIEGLCRLAAELKGLSPESILNPVRERERLGSTGVGGGVAIPHGKTDELEEVLLVLARTKPQEALDWDSPDRRPVKLLALVVSPAKATTDHMRVLLSLGRIWKTGQNIEAMLEAPDKESFLRLFLELSAQSAA